MTTLTLAPRTDFTPLDPDYYILTLDSYEIRDKDADKFHAEAYQDVQFQWSVNVPDGEPAQRRSWANVPKSFNEKSTLCKIGVALGAIDPQVAASEGIELDLDRWVGRRCRGNIVEIVKADGTISDKIEGYAPYKGKASNAPIAAKPAPRAKPAPPVEDDEEDSLAF